MGPVSLEGLPENALHLVESAPSSTCSSNIRNSRLRAALKLKLADAVQAASALAIGAKALVTHDRDFSAVRDLRVLGTRRDSPSN